MKEKSVQQMRRLIDGQGQIEIQIEREKERNKDGQIKIYRKREIKIFRCMREKREGDKEKYIQQIDKQVDTQTIIGRYYL